MVAQHCICGRRLGQCAQRASDLLDLHGLRHPAARHETPRNEDQVGLALGHLLRLLPCPLLAHADCPRANRWSRQSSRPRSHRAVLGSGPGNPAARRRRIPPPRPRPPWPPDVLIGDFTLNAVGACLRAMRGGVRSKLDWDSPDHSPTHFPPKVPPCPRAQALPDPGLPRSCSIAQGPCAARPSAVLLVDHPPLPLLGWWT